MTAMDSKSFLEPYSQGRNKVTKYLLAVLLSLSVLGVIAPKSKMFLALIPYTITSKFYFWTIVTAGFFETSALMAIINIVILAGVGPFLAHRWGEKTFLRFIAIVNINIMISTLAIMIIGFYSTHAEYFIFSHSCGFTGITASFAVSLKQLIPDKPIFPLGRLDSFKMKHLPMTAVCVSIVVWIVGGYGKELPLVLSGIFYSWLYLRFFQVDPETQVVGDPRDEFAFATLFPGILQPFVSALSVLVLKAFIGMGFFKQSTSEQNRLAQAQALEMQTSQSHLHSYDHRHLVNFTTTADPAAERRRALAIKAIDAKLAALSIPSRPLPSLDGDAETAGSPSNSSTTPNDKVAVTIQ